MGLAINTFCPITPLFCCIGNSFGISYTAKATVTNIYVVKNLLNILWSIANAIPMELIVFQESMRCIVL